MILADKDATPARFYVPLNGFDFDPLEMVLEAFSTADNTVTMLVVDDWEIHTEGGVKEAFARLEVTLPLDMPLGEYEYTLTADGETVSRGILQVLESQAEPMQYNKEIVYRQYGE